MTIARSAADVLSGHVTLEVECIDRMYLNVYVPKLQYEAGVVGFLRDHRGADVCVVGADGPDHQAVRQRDRAVRRRARAWTWSTFEKGQRKDDVAHEYLAGFGGEEGVLFVGKAQEKTTTFRTEKRRNPSTGASYPWIVRTTAMVNQYYMYCVDRDFGPFFIKFCSYFPYNAKLCINGNEWAKRQAANAGIALRGAGQRLRGVRGPGRVCSGSATASAPAKIDALSRKWLRRSAAPVHRPRPSSRLSLRHLDPAGRVLAHPGARPAADAGACSSRTSSARTWTSAALTRSSLIFNTRISRRTPSRFRTRVITEGVTPSLHVDYKHSRIKQYHKQGRALRTETTINDTRDFGIGKRLHNLPALREIGFTANRRLLDVQRISADCHRRPTGLRPGLPTRRHRMTSARPRCASATLASRRCSASWSSFASCPPGSPTATCEPTSHHCWASIPAP